MESPVPEYLQEVLDSCALVDGGAVADYIPELADEDPDRLAVAVATMDGPVHAAGDADARFTIQSISKAFTYALALRDRGLQEVLAVVGVEPSGDAFNEISLEEDSGRPRNPMINVGAIVAHSLVGPPGIDDNDRTARILAGLSAFAGRELAVDEAVLSSELETAHRNLALAHMVRSYGIFPCDPEEIVAGYTRQCSAVVDVRDLAVMAATLAHGGTNPVTGEEVVPTWAARQTLSVMATCGMYDAAGDWFTTVGIPAKSGVAGGIIGALPGQVGVASFSPRLDPFGNSTRGVRIFEQLSDDMGMHLMNTPAPGAALIRRNDRDADGRHVIEIQGALHFAEAELLLRTLAEIEPGGCPVLLDASRITSSNLVGRRMLVEGIGRLGADGHPVEVVGPDTLLAGTRHTGSDGAA